MADLCEYKCIVKGKKNACYAFFGSQICADEKEIVKESGTDENYSLYFYGDCKWALNLSDIDWNPSSPVILPKNPQKAMAEMESLDYGVPSRSKVFQVEVIGCWSPDEDYTEYFHYINGEDMNDEDSVESTFDDEFDEDFEE